MIIKQDADTFVEVVVQDTLSLKELRRELQALKDEPDPIRPPNAELIDWAIENHPFFITKQTRRNRIEDLKRKIAKYEVL